MTNASAQYVVWQEHTILWAAAQGLAGVVRYKISCARQGSGDIINKKQDTVESQM